MLDYALIGEGVLEREERRLRVGHAVEGLARGVGVVCAEAEDRMERAVELPAQELAAAVDRGEHRLGLVEAAPHRRVLRPVAGEDEGDRRRPRAVGVPHRQRVGLRAVRVRGQQLAQLPEARADGGEPVGQRGPAGVGRVGHVGGRQLGWAARWSVYRRASARSAVLLRAARVSSWCPRADGRAAQPQGPPQPARARWCR